MDTFTMGEFTVSVDNQGIRLKKGGEEFKFQPGESSNITTSLALVARMASMPALPNKFEQGSYSFFFQSDGTVGLFRSEEENGLSFDIDKTDALVDVINAATAKYADYVRLRGGPRRGVAAQTPEPIIEGR